MLTNIYAEITWQRNETLFQTRNYLRIQCCYLHSIATATAALAAVTTALLYNNYAIYAAAAATAAAA